MIFRVAALEHSDNVVGCVAGTTLVPIACGLGLVAPAALGTQLKRGYQ